MSTVRSVSGGIVHTDSSVDTALLTQGGGPVPAGGLQLFRVDALIETCNTSFTSNKQLASILAGPESLVSIDAWIQFLTAAFITAHEKQEMITECMRSERAPTTYLLVTRQFPEFAYVPPDE